MSHTESVHLVVLVHGMWGSPSNLDSLLDVLDEKYPAVQDLAVTGVESGTSSKLKSKRETATTNQTRRTPLTRLGSSPSGHEVAVLIASTNEGIHTYDGIQWGGERIITEIRDHIDQIEASSTSSAQPPKRVTRFSITGYSLGGLLSRYVVGALHKSKFFEKVEPVNFNTIATPHLGIPRYPSFLSGIHATVGPRLLGETGSQFYGVDSFGGPGGRPLLEVMASPDSVFVAALSSFKNLTIYANSVNDTTVPYLTAAIETRDPFLYRHTNGIEITHDSNFILESFIVPPVPPPRPPKPARFSRAWWQSVKSTKVPLPPRLQFAFPLNFLMLGLVPIILPVLLTLVLTRLSLDSRASSRRIRNLEKDKSRTEAIRALLGSLEQRVEAHLVDYVENEGPADAPIDPDEHPEARSGPTSGEGTPLQSHRTLEIESGENGLGARRSSDSDTTAVHDADQTVSVDASKSQEAGSERTPGKAAEDGKVKAKGTPLLTPAQKEMARNLNALPNLRKRLVWFEDVQNAHGIIVARDRKRFQLHEKGMGVVRDWAEQLEI